MCMLVQIRLLLKPHLKQKEREATNSKIMKTKVPLPVPTWTLKKGSTNWKKVTAIWNFLCYQVKIIVKDFSQLRCAFSSRWCG